MESSRLELMRNYLENSQLHLQTVNHTKVGTDWKYYNLVPEVNRLYYIREGEGWIKVRSREYSPQPGQLFWLPAGVEQSFASVNENTFRKYWCHFTVTVGDIHLLQLLSLPHYVEVREHVKLENQFRQLMKHHTSTDWAAPLRVKSILYDILYTYMELAAAQSEPGMLDIAASAAPSIARIHTILEYIDKHLDEQMTIEQLAKLIHFHPNYFIQLFKSRLGIAPIEYINKKRMDKAQRLLAVTDLAVSEIARQVGMELYYFSRMFKKRTGLSPSEYRHYSK
jgi:AraC-like DNA-binding protein